MSHDRLRRIAAVSAKLVFATGVFATTVAGWSLVAPHVTAHRPLPDADGAEGRCAIWFVGSSSIHRWTSMAADMAPWQVHNRGVNGALLGEVTARFLNEQPAGAPGAIVFYLGENDIAAGADPAAVEEAVVHLAREARRRMPETRLFVLGLKPSPARWSQRTRQLHFNAQVSAWAGRTGTATFLDVGSALLTGGAPGDFFQPDGIHLDEAGYRRWARGVRNGIERAMPAETIRACTHRRPAAA